MMLFHLFDTIADAISGFIWRWSYQHRTRHGTQLAAVQAWRERR